MTSQLGWHFTAHKTRGRGGWRLKQIEHMEPPIVLCRRGLHAGSALTALNNAPGPWVSWVELSGEVVGNGNGKWAGEVRTRLAGPVDATRVLREFACDCAERALLRERQAGREPDRRCWAAVEMVRRYAHDEATAEEAGEAARAAKAAARAAKAAARAAKAAARAAKAARAATEAAKAAAWTAAEAVAAAATGVAMATKAAEETAKAAAWAALEARTALEAEATTGTAAPIEAARTAERNWQKAELDRRLRELVRS